MDYLQYLGILALASLLRLLPLTWTARLAEAAAVAAFHVMKHRRTTALANLDRVLGPSKSESQKRAIARDSFKHMAVSIAELLYADRIIRERQKRVTFSGRRYIDEALAQGKGVILFMSHCGAWEFNCLLGLFTDYAYTVVVKSVKNPYLDRKLNQIRRSFRITPEVKRKAASKQLLAALRQNAGATVVIDQWAGPEGIWVEFFGIPTSTTSMPVRLAEKTGAPLVPLFCIREKPGYFHLQLLPPVAIQEGKKGREYETTAALNRVLEDQIKRHPGQWLWSHRRWRSKPHTLREPAA